MIKTVLWNFSEVGEPVSDGVLHGNCDTISGPGSNQDHIGGPTTNLVRSAHIVACGPAVPSWSPAILYRGQWSVCNFKSGANTIRGRINYSSTHDRRRYFSLLFVPIKKDVFISWLHWILNILWFLRILTEFFYWYDKKHDQNHQFRLHIGTVNVIMKIKCVFLNIKYYGILF